MNKHFATVVVLSNAMLIAGFLGIRGWLPSPPEKIEIVEEQKIEALHCRKCTVAVDHIPAGKRLDDKLDDNAERMHCVITKLHPEPKKSYFMWFETKNLLFRTVKVEDADALYEICRKPEVAARHLWKAHRSKLETLELIRHWLGGYKSYYFTPWAIEDKETGALLGSGGISRVTMEEPRCSVSCAITNKIKVGENEISIWDKNYEAEALQALAEYALVMTNSARIEAHARCDDQLGQYMVELAGFSKEGVEPEYKLIDGKYIDIFDYSMLAKEVSPAVKKNSVLKQYAPGNNAK